MVPMSSTPDPAARPAPDPAPGPVLSDDPEGLLGADALRPVSVSLIRARYVAGIVGDVLCVLMIAGAITSASLTGIW